MAHTVFQPTQQVLANLLRAQFPHWAGLEIDAVRSSGTDNTTYRLGPELVARLPKSSASVPALVKEQPWLPRLERKLQTRVPHLVARGRPSSDYPAPWSINRWIEGETYREDAITDWAAFVSALVTFLKALQQTDTTGAPPPGPHNFGRGAPLVERDRRVHHAIQSIASSFDPSDLHRAWEEDSQAPALAGPLRWLHGDIHAQNILLAEGRLHAIIDFGCLGIGDPACELALAWRLLPDHARSLLHTALQPDAATWRRARAWALSISVMEMQHYAATNPVLTAIAARTIREVLKDHLN